ncbi:putative methyltransferase PMT20 [Trifolium repens]|nr:putative methyltransferase PMT20 [Trifolium repens]
MKHKDGKPINQPNKNRSLTAAITIILLCGLSFYLGGDFKSGNSGVVDVNNTIQKTLDSPKPSSDLLYWNAIALRFPRGNNAYSLLHLVTSLQSDGQRVEMNVGTEMCHIIGLTSKSLISIG